MGGAQPYVSPHPTSGPLGQIDMDTKVLLTGTGKAGILESIVSIKSVCGKYSFQIGGE